MNIIRFTCDKCNKVCLGEQEIYTTFLQNSGFICDMCYKLEYNKNIIYEQTTSSKYIYYNYNRPICDKCFKQVTTDTWIYCEKCNMDFCNRCTKMEDVCNKCNGMLIRDKYEFDKIKK